MPSPIDRKREGGAEMIMWTIRYLFRALLVAAVAMAAPTVAEAMSYIFTTFDVPGYSGTFLSGINNNGEVVGGYGFDTPNFGSVAFVANDGKITTIEVPGYFVNALGINNKGQIVGSYLVNSPNNIAWQGFIDKNGTFTSIAVPGADATQAFGINGRGEVIGLAVNYTTNVGTSFIYNDGGFSPINVPGSYSTEALGINNNDQIIGFYVNSNNGNQHGFLYYDGTYTSIDISGAIDTVPLGINNRGQIVGYFLNSNSYQEGFMYIDGKFTLINVPSAVNTSAWGINDLGQIVGGYVIGGVEHGFIAIAAR